MPIRKGEPHRIITHANFMLSSRAFELLLRVNYYVMHYQMERHQIEKRYDIEVGAISKGLARRIEKSTPGWRETPGLQLLSNRFTENKIGSHTRLICP